MAWQQTRMRCVRGVVIAVDEREAGLEDANWLVLWTVGGEGLKLKLERPGSNRAGG